MDWFGELITEFLALPPKDQIGWIGTAFVPTAAAVYAVFAFFAGKWPFRRDTPEQITNEKPAHPTPVQNVTVSVPDNRPNRTEGEIVGIFHDLDDDAKSRVLETLSKIAGQPPEPGETKEEIAEAVEEARAGDLTDIRALLNARYQKLAGEHGAVAKSLAEAARDLAAVEFRDDVGRALALYRQATELEPDHFWSWIELGRTQRLCESLEAALESFDRALSIANRNDDNREIAVAEIAKADTFVASGNLGRAEKRYLAANEAMTRRTDAVPDDVERQRDLSVSHNKIGDVRVSQGDLPQALEAFQAGLDIAEKLAAADPGNAEWQRDLVVSNVRLADAGNRPKERLSRALEIAQALSDSGRLAPVDHGMIDDLKKRIADLPED